jgi:hypothetical protein
MIVHSKINGGAPMPTSSAHPRSGLLQRKCACGGEPDLSGECEDCRKKRLSLHRRAGNIEEGTSSGPLAPPIVHEALRTPGRPLDPVTRAFMEPRFGHAFGRISVHNPRAASFQSQLTISKPVDIYEQEAEHVANQIVHSSAPPLTPGFDFSRVRLHSDPQAAASARSLNSRAYTVGRDIIFAEGEYAPHTTMGRQLLAHELTHVLQQHRGAVSPGLTVQRAISPQLDKIESLLSYGIFDWVITDAEAIEALEILKTLPKYQQAVFFSNAKYSNRLRDNLPENRLPELHEIEQAVADLRPPTSEIEDIRSKLSYGLFHWIITEKDAIAALEKLEKLPATQVAVALASINYSRLLNHLPDNRKQELIDLMAKNLATGGARTVEEQTHPGSILGSISFKSDHGVMKDNKSDWSPAGPYYGEPEWFVGQDSKVVSKPISQTMGTNITAEVSLNVLPLGATAAPMTLRGEGSESFLKFNFSGTMQGGVGQKVLLTSEGKLPDAVKAFRDKQIRWRMQWRDWDHEIAQSSHTVFVTMNSPHESEDASVTYKRMAKAVEIVGALGTLAPHAVVKGIMKNWNRYALEVPLHYPVLKFADEIARGGQCIDIVRFVRAVIEMVGCPGTVQAVVIWAYPGAPHTPIESIWGMGGMRMVGPHPAHPDWIATLLDGDWHANNFEAALKFDDGSTLAYYPGGVSAVFATPLQVLHVFKCLAWIKGTGGKDCRIMEVPADYPFGPCPVGSEHECFVQ